MRRTNVVKAVRGCWQRARSSAERWVACHPRVALFFAFMRRVATGTISWGRRQARDIRHELRRALRPAVRVKRLRHAVGISTAGAWPKALVVPTNSGEMLNLFSEPAGSGGFLVCLEKGNQRWEIATFDERVDADYCVGRISRTMFGSGRRGVILPALMVAAVVLIGGGLLRGVGASAPPAAAATLPEGEFPSPVGDVLRVVFGPAAPTGRAGEEALAQAAATGTVDGTALAAQIYEQSMAAAQQSQYTQGPPVGPVNPGVADFGLGNTGLAGCDPALRFTVAP